MGERCVTLPRGSLKESVKESRKQEAAQTKTRKQVSQRLAMVGHWPWWVRTGHIIWKPITEPVGRRFERWAVPLNAFLATFWTFDFGFLGASGNEDISKCCVSAITLKKKTNLPCKVWMFRECLFGQRFYGFFCFVSCSVELLCSGFEVDILFFHFLCFCCRSGFTNINVRTK